MRRFALVAILALAGCGTLATAFSPDPVSGKSPAEERYAPIGDAAGATGTPWGLVAAALFGSGGAVFTIGKTLARAHAAKAKRDAAKPA